MPGGRRSDFDLEEMFALRRAGWSTTKLGKKYGKDHSTIVHHCKKHGVVPIGKVTVETDGSITEEEPEEAPRPRVVSKYQHLLDQEDLEIRPPKTYAQLLKDAGKRKGPEARYYRRFAEFGYPTLGPVGRSSARAAHPVSDHCEN